MTWTTERVAELTRLWDTGRSASEIGKMLGVSKNSVVGKAHRLKLPGRPSPIKQTGTKKIRTKPTLASPRPASMPVQAAPPPPPPRAAPRRSGKGPNCLWPIGDPGDADFHFCGDSAVPGKPYCDEHCARAYINKNRDEATKAA